MYLFIYLFVNLCICLFIYLCFKKLGHDAGGDAAQLSYLLFRCEFVEHLHPLLKLLI